MEVYKDSWHGLNVKDVELRLHSPGPESELVGISYNWTLNKLNQLDSLIRHLPPPINGELYISMGRNGLREAVRETVNNWGWEPSDRSWIKTPIAGRLGRQRWCLTLTSREISQDNRFRIGLWVPKSPNQGLYVIHSLFPNQNLMATKLKTALLANALWVHLNEVHGNKNVLAEWGIITGQDQALARSKEAPLSVCTPFPMQVSTRELINV